MSAAASAPAQPTAPAPAPQLKRATTAPVPASGSTMVRTSSNPGEEWLSERLPAGQQPFSEAMLLRITSDTSFKDPNLPPRSSPREEGASGSRQAWAPVSTPSPSLASAAGAVGCAADSSEDGCPLVSLGSTPPLPIGKEPEAECKVCFDVKPLPMICAACPLGQGACAVCLKTYFTTAVNDALYAMPMIRCPLCRGRIDTQAWAPFVDQATQDKYLGNASALLSLRCPDCDETTSFFADSQNAPIGAGKGELAAARRRAALMKAQLFREELWCDLLSTRATASRRLPQHRWGANGCVTEEQRALQTDARTRRAAEALVDSWWQFQAAEASADEFIARLHCAWPPGRGGRPPQGLRRAARTKVPLCIEDPERRLAAQLGWLRRYPKVRTPCCLARICFKCKVRGWHRGVTCEERQRREAGRAAQFCPNCRVPTTRSDGCNHIRCVCGAEWTWNEANAENGGADDDDDADMGDSDMDDDSPPSGSASEFELRRVRSSIELAALSPGFLEGSDICRGVASARVLEALLDAPRRSFPRGPSTLAPPLAPQRPGGPIRPNRPEPAGRQRRGGGGWRRPEGGRSGSWRIRESSEPSDEASDDAAAGVGPGSSSVSPAAGARAASSGSGGVVYCPGGHLLARLRNRDASIASWICDGCEDRKSRQRYRCQACDFDLCRPCYRSIAVENGRSSPDAAAAAAAATATAASSSGGAGDEGLGVSRLNEQYCCKVEDLQWCRQGFLSVRFRATGDGSLGSMQDPGASRLSYLPSEGEAIGEPVKFTPCELEYVQNDTQRCIEGKLLFKNVDPGKVRLRFEYGESGYSNIELTAPKKVEEASSTPNLNDEGASVTSGGRYGPLDGSRRYYCGRKLGVEAIPGSDGRCGPTAGPQCASCQRFQAAKKALRSRSAASPGSSAGSAGGSSGSSSSSISSPSSEEAGARPPWEQRRGGGAAAHQQLPLHLAVRSRSPAAVKALLDRGAVPSEQALRELVKISDAEARGKLEALIRPKLEEVRPGSLPLWARIYFNLSSGDEDLKQLDLGSICLNAMTALRRQQDPECRQRYEGAMRKHLSDEWFETLAAEAATEELRTELREALARRRPPNMALVQELLASGADAQTREHLESEEEDSYSDGEVGDRPLHRHTTNAGSSARDREEHASVSDYWCPGFRDQLSCADLVALQGHVGGAAFDPSFARQLLRGVASAEALSAPAEGEGTDEARRSTAVAAARRRGRLLTLALHSGNAAAVRELLETWGESSPLPAAAWRGLCSVHQDAPRREFEAELAKFITARGLDEAQVPLWALLQLGSRRREDGSAAADAEDKVARCKEAMHDEGCVKLEALLAAEPDEQEHSSDEDSPTIPDTVFTALRRCDDQSAREHLEGILRARLGEKRYKSQTGKVATRTLFRELRTALRQRRTPDLKLSSELLRRGADPKARERDDVEEEPWEHRAVDEFGDEIQEEDKYGGWRRSILDLLALNRHADPQAMSTAIASVISLRADPNRGGNAQRPLVLAVAARNTAAVEALLEGGAEMTRQALVGLKKISSTELRRRMEAAFFKQYSAGGKPQTISLQWFEDIGLWASVQCGFVTTACKAIEGGALVGTSVMMGLRRCRSQEARLTLEVALRKRLPSRWFDSLRAEAATEELQLELREALDDRRDPEEELVRDLLRLGANPEARNTSPDVGVDGSDFSGSEPSDDDEEDDDDEHRSQSSHENDDSDYSFG